MNSKTKIFHNNPIIKHLYMICGKIFLLQAQPSMETDKTKSHVAERSNSWKKTKKEKKKTEIKGVRYVVIWKKRQNVNNMPCTKRRILGCKWWNPYHSKH